MLEEGAAMLGMTYNEINIYVFVIVWPLLTLSLLILLMATTPNDYQAKANLPKVNSGLFIQFHAFVL